MNITRYAPLAFSIDGFLTADECAQLIDLAETAGFRAAGVRTPEGEKTAPYVRNNERAMAENEQWVGYLWNKLCAAAELPEIDGQTPRGFPKSLRFYKYSAGQRFKMHKDGPWHEDGLTSRLTFLLYLNDDFVGGATAFKEFSVQPRQGMAVIFVHEAWHEGSLVETGTKYALRSDILYG